MTKSKNKYGVCLTAEAVELYKNEFIGKFIHFKKYLSCESIDSDSYYLRVIAEPSPHETNDFPLNNGEFLIPHQFVLFVVTGHQDKSLGFYINPEGD